VTWQPGPGNQHQIESQVEPREIGAGQQECLGSSGNSALLAGPQRLGGRPGITSQLDLDHREHAAAPREYVDLAGRTSPIASEDAPATQP
jgi:hypothetical protein